MGLNSSQIKYGNCIETSDARVEADAMQMQGLRLLSAANSALKGNHRRQRVLQMTEVISATVNSFDYN